jgi:hypothetical protein
MIVPESKLGVLVVEGIVERLTGGGKFVVSPVRAHDNVEVGDQVMIIILDKLQAEVSVEALNERVTSPFPSNWAIIVRGNRYVGKCCVFLNGTQLRAMDPAGVLMSTQPLPRDGVLNFRIPDTLNVDNESIVEVRDGDRSIQQGKFGLIGVALSKERYPTVTVSGRFSPLNRVDASPANVDFTNTATGQKFSAPVTNGQYSLLLPNRESYRAIVSWTTTSPGIKSGTTEAVTLHLDVNAQAYSFDVN